MANIYLTLDLKKKELYDDGDQLYYSFNKWSYDIDTKIFDLDDKFTIEYDLISEFIFDRNISSGIADIKISDNTVVDIDNSGRFSKAIKDTLISEIEDFIEGKDLEDGYYKVKYEYWYNFSEDDFIVEVLEVDYND